LVWGVCVEFGLNPKMFGDYFEEALEQTLLAEKVGFSSVWIMEHHCNRDYLPSPLLALGTLAAHARRMKVGTNIMILPINDPVRVAEEGAMLDVLTKGKFILGVGVGYRPRDFNTFGIPLKERAGRMEEQLEIIKRLWMEESVSHEGRFYRFKDVTIDPRPVQKPRPPIWIGGWMRSAIERAAEMGDTWFPGPVGDLPRLEEGLKIYRDALKRLGKNVSDLKIPLNRELYVAEDHDRAVEEAKPHLIHMYLGDYASSEHPFFTGDAEENFEKISQDRFIIGDPDECIASIEKYRSRLNVDHMVFRMHFPGMSHDRVMNSIRLFGEKVIPYFTEK